jgi:dimethylglycine oxidase
VAYSRLRDHIGYVYLPRALAVPGTPLEVEVFGARLAAEVSPDVLYDASGARIRS